MSLNRSASRDSTDTSSLDDDGPSCRDKPAICFNDQDQCYYLMGGLAQRVASKQLWRYSTEIKTWDLVQPKDRPIKPLHGHTLVAWQNSLYAFGGTFVTAGDTRLYIFNLSSLTSRSHVLRGDQPRVRTGHTCIVHKDSMYLYGGFEDFHGSVSQLWQFDFHEEQWTPLGGLKRSNNDPQARYNHSAVLYGDQMYILGGICSNETKRDLWRYTFSSKYWTELASCPSKLEGHSAVVCHNLMYVFSGDSTCTDLLIYNFASDTWSKTSFCDKWPFSGVKLSNLRACGDSKHCLRTENNIMSLTSVSSKSIIRSPSSPTDSPSLQGLDHKFNSFEIAVKYSVRLEAISFLNADGTVWTKSDIDAVNNNIEMSKNGDCGPYITPPSPPTSPHKSSPCQSFIVCAPDHNRYMRVFEYSL